MFFVVLQLLFVTRLSFGTGNQEYITLINIRHSNAEQDRGFQCYTPPIVPGNMLSYGRSYQVDSTDSLTDIPWIVSITKTRYITPEPAVAGGNVGVYYCKFVNDGVTTIVQTTKVDSDAVIIPSNDKTSVSTNVGDNVTIFFDVVGNVNRPFVWRKDGVEITSDDTESLTFNPVHSYDAGMYEMHGNGQRSDRKHSFIKLIVRECPRHKWGPPDCTGDCEYCYNGGVCDDKTGLCICAPGFNGNNCEIECGGNKFGWDCDQSCTYYSIDPNACKTQLYCLPDPYGCSCVTGYTDRYCRTPCSAGTFGAGCTQVCHCNSGTCDMFTGRCTGSDTTCQERWTGSNCQKCVSNHIGENCEQTCSKPCTCSRTGACVEGTCHPAWLGPKCETGISDTTFIPANYGEMTDAYCNISTRTSSSSTVDILLQVTTGDHKENKTWNYSGDDVGITIYKFTVLAVFGTKYTCLIQHEGAYAEKEISPNIFQQPSYNGILQAVVLSGSSIEVSWTEWNNVTNTGDGPIRGYILQYRKTNDDEDDDNWEQTSIVNGLSTIVEGLHWETSYTFAVSAVREGEGGQGPTGEQQVDAQTLCGEPESIKNIHLEILGTDSTTIIQVTWLDTEIEHDFLKCSDLTYYYYTVYVKIGNGEGAEYGELYRGQNTVFLFGDVKIGTDYVIAVTVSNKDSESIFMERSIRAPLDIHFCQTYIIIIIIQAIILTLLVVCCLVQFIQRRRIAGSMKKTENNSNEGDEGKGYAIPSPVIAAEYHAPGIVNSGADCGDYAVIRQIPKHK